MEKIIELINKTLVPITIKIKNIKWLTAIGDGVMATFPILMIGSFGTLIAYFPNEEVLAWLQTTPIYHISLTLGTLSNGLMGLIAAVAIAYSMSKQIDSDEFTNCILAVMSFIILQGFTAGSIATSGMGAQGLFVAMIIGVLIPMISKWLIDKGFYLKMPSGVPPMIERTFAALVPTLVVLLLSGIVEWAFSLTEWGNVITAFYTLIQRPFTSVAATLPSFILCIVCGVLVNFVGVHSTALTNLWLPFLTAAAAENLAAVTAGAQPTNMVTEIYRAYYAVGGFGCFFGLQICMLFAKSERVKAVSRVSFIPAIFNINEPVLYGFPIMMNPIMLIPFLLAPILNCVLAYVTTLIGFLPISNGVISSWALPTPIRVYLAGLGWQGVVLTFVMIAMDTAIYYPFFKVADRRYVEEENRSEAEAA